MAWIRWSGDAMSVFISRKIFGCVDRRKRLVSGIKSRLIRLERAGLFRQDR